MADSWHEVCSRIKSYQRQNCHDSLFPPLSQPHIDKLLVAECPVEKWASNLPFMNVWIAGLLQQAFDETDHTDEYKGCIEDPSLLLEVVGDAKWVPAPSLNSITAAIRALRSENGAIRSPVAFHQFSGKRMREPVSQGEEASSLSTNYHLRGPKSHAETINVNCGGVSCGGRRDIDGRTKIPESKRENAPYIVSSQGSQGSSRSTAAITHRAEHLPASRRWKDEVKWSRPDKGLPRAEEFVDPFKILNLDSSEDDAPVGFDLNLESPSSTPTQSCLRGNFSVSDSQDESGGRRGVHCLQSPHSRSTIAVEDAWDGQGRDQLSGRRRDPNSRLSSLMQRHCREDAKGSWCRTGRSKKINNSKFTCMRALKPAFIKCASSNEPSGQMRLCFVEK
eukprot:GHVN01001900.1.p2 GENE.GHVN01001900.1~~GHVN01001900.1.p2  ORF type:complete len:392 (-),score=36.33 GHVN01001900.1:5177-6352(-)